MSKVLGRDAILSANDLTFEDVRCPEFGPESVVRIRNLTAGQRGIFIERQASKDPSHQRTNEMLLVSLCAIDENGKRLFSADDVALIAEKAAAPVKRLAEVALRLSGLLPGASAEAGKGLGPATS